MMAVDVMSSSNVFSAGKPKLLFEGHYESPAVRANLMSHETAIS